MDYLLNYDLDAQQVTEENVQHLHQNDLTEAEKQQAQQAEQAQAQQTAAENEENNKENK